MLITQTRSLVRRLDAIVGNATSSQLLSLPVFVIGLLTSTLLRVLGTPFGTNSSLVDQVSVGWITFLLLWLWMQTVTRLLIRFGLAARYWIFASVLLGAALRGALVDFAVGRNEQEPVELLGYRMLSSVLLVGLVMLLASYALNVMQKQSVRLDQLAANRKALSDALKSSSFELDEWFSMLIFNTRARMMAHLGKASVAKPSITSLKLKSLISEVVRPTSSELAKGIPPNPKITEPRFTQKQTFVSMVRAAASSRWRLLPVRTPIVIALLSVPGVYVFGNASGFEVFAGFALLQWIGLSIANYLFQMRPDHWSDLRGAILLQCLVFAANLLPAYFAVSWIGFLELRPTYFHNSALLLTLGFSLISLLVSTVDAASRGAKQAQSDLEEAVADLRWHLAKTKGEMWRRQQSLARVLHGPIQANITANSIRIDLAKSVPERGELERKAATETYEAIESIADLALEAPAFDRDLNGLAKSWAGICDVHIDSSMEATFALVGDATAARIVLDLLQDALSNSVRHGAASQIFVRLELETLDLLRVVVTDNGAGLPADFAPGLGSYHLDVLTTKWSLNNLQPGLPGTRLEFFVPVSTSKPRTLQFTDSGFLG